MAERIIQAETLKGIADSIRSKTGKSEAIPVPNMASEIKGIVSDETTKYFEEQYAEVSLPNATKIKRNAFYSDATLFRISIPNVTEIHQYAFYMCTNLQHVELSDCLAGIYTYAFSGTDLRTFTFKNKPTSIASNAFTSCLLLHTINVPWPEGAVEGAPWGAASAQINYNYVEGE